MNQRIHNLLVNAAFLAESRSSGTWRALHLQLVDYFNRHKNDAQGSLLQEDNPFFVFGIISHFENKGFRPSYRKVLITHLRTVLKMAGYENMAAFIPDFDLKDFSKRDVFTKLEIDILKRAASPNDIFKKTSIFMALTGLRRCDARNKNNKLLGGDLLHYTDSKTGGEHKIKLSKEALKLFEETDFSAFDESNAISVKIHHEWIGNAGINSKETPHIYRHCYASNELQRGANLHSISKDLGHNSIAQTLIYARLVSPGYTTVMVEKDGIQKSVGYLNTAYKRNLDLMLSHVDSDLIDTWFKEGTVNETPEGILTRSYKQDDYSISLITNKNE